MTRASFRQADIERILRAAKAVGATVQIDLKTYMITIYHPATGKTGPSELAPDGPENWDDDDDWTASV